MRRIEWITVIGWFLLAGFVIWRCFFGSSDADYGTLFAAWCGGVLSLACVEIVRRRRAGRPL